MDRMMSNYYEGSTGSTETIQTSGSTVSKEIVEKVHHPASQAKEFNPVILGKHPRVNEVEEINQIAQESEKSRRLFNRRAGKSATRNANNDAKKNLSAKVQEAVADLTEDNTGNWIHSLERRAWRRLKSQDPQDKKNNHEFKERLNQKMAEILNHMSTFKTELYKYRIEGSSITFVKGRKLMQTLDTHEILIRLSNENSVIPFRKQIEPRILQILRGFNLYHNWLSRKGLDLELIGKRNAYEDLLEWFWKILFEGTQGRLPLLGWVAIQYPLQNPEVFFNSDAQKYIVELLSGDLKVTLERCFESSIKLMGYWYQDTSEAMKNRPLVPGQYSGTTYSEDVYFKMVAWILEGKPKPENTQE
ncbi:hypothetical protein Pst134EA_013649 [Puccinia striiformis f. sp. tritici]|nr:hypothetical protein Pst134EA_013649 [Puccinia striiformis f. sp. tritici]KAH9465784.1 hypothetical protein Pst134EA_013649 [Puccinia striiformis f. sp. tritici]